eukprot:GHVN01036769.1.p1 GENE.GHVN01036769.1~~GHVN01036769.1.p1  ORF type:complete len:217 (-),score=33.27 GHVN01036769.1:123-773(-)
MNSLAYLALLASLANTQTIFERTPGNPGLTGVKPSPNNFICPLMSFEPRSPLLSMRYGPFTFYNAETITPDSIMNAVDGCGNSVPLEDNGYINETAPERGPDNVYEIVQIVAPEVMKNYLDRSLWICWKAPETTRVEITPQSAATRLLVYAGCGCSQGTAPLIGCIDGRDIGASGTHYPKRVVFDTVEKHDYMIRVGLVRGEGLDDSEVLFDIQRE